MSHNATSWAMGQNHLKPSARIVLFCLADHHNIANNRCDPDQETIAMAANMSPRSVRDQLTSLEKSGLIKRNAQLGINGVFNSTNYLLKFDMINGGIEA